MATVATLSLQNFIYRIMESNTFKRLTTRYFIPGAILMAFVVYFGTMASNTVTPTDLLNSISTDTITRTSTSETQSPMLTWKDILALAQKGNPKPDRKVVKTEAEWKAQLTEEQFYVMRKKGTERPFSTEMCSRFEPGIYACAGCGTPMFDSETKYQSGTGWPSFSLPLKDNVVSYVMDNTLGMTRIEAVCSTCDGHLGHVFPDGPQPSGLRFCINAASLKKVEL